MNVSIEKNNPSLILCSRRYPTSSNQKSFLITTRSLEIPAGIARFHPSRREFSRDLSRFRRAVPATTTSESETDDENATSSKCIELLCMVNTRVGNWPGFFFQSGADGGCGEFSRTRARC